MAEYVAYSGDMSKRYRRRVSSQASHASSRVVRRTSHVGVIMVSVICVLALVGALAYAWRTGVFGGSDTDSAVTTPVVPSAPGESAGLTRQATPKPDVTAMGKARRLVSTMDVPSQVGQLVMVPLFAGTDPASLMSDIADRHVGSVLIIGNWTGGVSAVRSAVDQAQGYAPDANKLIVATDQEGGLVQHLTGPGFDTMPSAVEQGAMTADQLRESAGTWGAQLAAAGINVDLAPVLGTVTVNRATNAPIGALNRDFGLDAAGNAAHGMAFVEGMRKAGIQSSVKHYPGLGAVTGNTDFTADGIVDTTTTLGGAEAGAFDTAIKQANPAMVMMSLATYQAIDPNNPAAFSSTIIDGHIRADLGYDGVVISDSLSAEALSVYDTSQLGVKLIEAGGDLACIGQVDYVAPILDGLNARAASDPAFAAKVKAAATRVLALKISMGLVQGA